MTAAKMKLEIWSDITCPFCYIGKRKLENALSQFKDAEHVEVIWRSFELAPGFKTQPDKNMHQFLSEFKGISLKQAVEISDQVAGSARQVGLEYNFHKAIPTNSFNAHRLSHFAKHRNLQEDAEETLFKGYFTNGKNIDDILTLIELGKEIGLDPAEVKHVLESERYNEDVRKDLYEAKQMGITSVPFFVFDRRTKISGAPESTVILETLEKTFAEWQKENPAPASEITSGSSCKVGEDCH